jgi:ribonuclease P protein component
MDLKKKNIVKEKRDFDRAFKLNNQKKSKYAFLYTYDTQNAYRFGICVSKKLGNAVTRNRLKRQIKDIIDKSKLHFESKDYIIVLKKSAVGTKYLKLKEDIINLLKNQNE